MSEISKLKTKLAESEAGAVKTSFQFSKVDIKRFWVFVDKKGPVILDTPCWLWTGCQDGRGYGFFSIDGRSRRAHRVSWCLANGDLTSGLVLDHLCKTKHCVNPSHLEQVTVKENTMRAEGPSAKNAVKTHCWRGHALTEENLRSDPKRPNDRSCHVCAVEQQRKARKRKKDEVARQLKIDGLMSENTRLREALEFCLSGWEEFTEEDRKHFSAELDAKIIVEKALALPTGQAVLEELRALREVAEASEKYLNTWQQVELDQLNEALDCLAKIGGGDENP